MAHLKVPVKQAWGPEFWSLELKVEKKKLSLGFYMYGSVTKHTYSYSLTHMQKINIMIFSCSFDVYKCILINNNIFVIAI